LDNAIIETTVAAVSRSNATASSLKPLVSVIIPTYNHAHYVSEAIESVLQQTYHNYEIIVVDDGSTDRTREAVAKYGTRVRYLWQQNQGLSSARNTGLRTAKGSLIGLLDADDTYEPDFLSTLVSILEASSNADGVYCRAQTVDVTNQPLPQQIGKVVPSERLYHALLEGGFFPPLCMFAHKYCYEQAGLFDESFQGCADWELWLRFSKQFSIVGTDRVLARYRVLPNSMSKNAAHMLDERLRAVRKHFPGHAEGTGNGNNPEYRKALANGYLEGAYNYLQAYDESNAYLCLREAFRCWPQLATELEPLYRLGLGAQPIGFRGDFSTLDLAHNVRLLFALLDQLMDDELLRSKLKPHRRALYANAYFAMGLLHYGTRQFDETRKQLLHAAVQSPAVILNYQYASTLVKSLLGVRLVDWMKQVKWIRRQMVGQ
jgi:glycosyltransferase involved in cell wall biosynthesis